jgi:alkyl sulfatase BDS1-like metallo-beta-lactamase superfamily hydrolase
MPEIGSDAWIEAFNAAVAGFDPGDEHVAVLHRIEGGPAWLVTVGGGSVAAVPVGDRTDDADITFTWQHADAEAVARGDASPLEPFQAGRLRIGGDLTRLTEVAGLFARLPSVPAA